MQGGLFWQGHMSVLTFLTQFPRKPLFMCTWKQQADSAGGTGLTQRWPPRGHVSVAVFVSSARVDRGTAGTLKNTEVKLSARRYNRL